MVDGSGQARVGDDSEQVLAGDGSEQVLGYGNEQAEEMVVCNTPFSQ